jgi:hypothetical protein
MVLFVLAFTLCWVWASVSRLLELCGGTPPQWLSWLQVVGVCLSGFSSFVVWITADALQLHRSCLRARCCCLPRDWGGGDGRQHASFLDQDGEASSGHSLSDPLLADQNGIGGGGGGGGGARHGHGSRGVGVGVGVGVGGGLRGLSVASQESYISAGRGWDPASWAHSQASQATCSPALSPSALSSGYISPPDTGARRNNSAKLSDTELSDVTASASASAAGGSYVSARGCPSPSPSSPADHHSHVAAAAFSSHSPKASTSKK